MEWILSIFGIVIVCLIVFYWGRFTYGKGLKGGIEVGLGLARGENYDDLIKRYGKV